jgi:VWFA-related protein
MTRFLKRRFFALALGLPLAAAGQSSEPITTLHANSNLVVVDVVVTDAHQSPVHQLTAADFSLFENNREQQVKIFEEHSANQNAPQPAAHPLDPGTFTNSSSAPVNGALNILLLDTLNTPLQDQPYVRAQLLKYLNEVPAGERIAIFGLGQQLHLILGFSSDITALRAALNGKKANPKASPLFDNPMTGDAVGDDNTMLDLNTEGIDNSHPSVSNQLRGTGPIDQLAILQQFLAEQQSFQIQLRLRYTLDAFNLLGRYLSNLPGRKNLIWFSGSFPINILPDGDLADPFAVVASYEDEFRKTVNLMARSQVAVYPIDARGLMASPMWNAANTGRSYAGSPTAFGKDQAKFSQNMDAEHDTMKEMAEATGGEAFYDTNDLKLAVQKAVEDGSNYYTLAYSPSNTNWKGDYRKIRVALARKGLNLSYRRGYYADDPNAPLHHGEPKITASDHVPYDAMRVAMLRGGPEPAEVIFQSKIRPVSTTPDAELAPGNEDNGKVKGPYRRYNIQFSVRPSDISCPESTEGAHHCELEFLTFVYDEDGSLLISQINGIKADIPPSRLAAVQANGLLYRQQIAVPVKGQHFLRLGVHDMVSDRVGALELPVFQVSRLPALNPPTPVPVAATPPATPTTPKND